MTFVFGQFELDPARRELRVEGKPRTLQPQVFDLLLYLVENHERVVPKRELLDTLWPETMVTESSLQRAVSLARTALGERGPALIQTFPRQGYRFVGELDRTRTPKEARLRARYALSGDVHIAFTTVGEGDTDFVLVNGWIMPMTAMFQHPDTRGIFEELGELGRVITFDKRGTGLSDRVKDLPPHEQRMDDLRVVLDACNSRQAILIGFSEGGALAMLYAATYPERVRGLILCGAFARMTKSHDFPHGFAPEEMERLKGYIRGGWGKGASLRPIAPVDVRRDADFLDFVSLAEQEGTSPGGAIDLLEMNLQIDLRVLLPTIRVPTIVMQAQEDGMIHPGNGAYLAEHIPGARYVEIAGADHVFYFRNRHEIVKAVDWILEQEPPELEADRFLSTVLVGRRNADLDQDVWMAHVKRFRGTVVPGSNHAYFDGPIRALHCAAALAEETGSSFGVHTGQVVRRGTEVRGSTFDVAQSIADRAAEGEAWASGVLVDLVPGSDLRFRETGARLHLQEREIALLSVDTKR